MPLVVACKGNHQRQFFLKIGLVDD